ncbi:polysaccharide ABC transporter ATP-binding protein [Hydrogenobacter hydrogenophilus]|uniref:Lipopolysaccharide transport system ATP-binding protein/teichoic acid transport system ATP-binding protein n=1 Tax=Hydrogenobacter hydrogenophilus TaxID=35835 RepID=A0A285NZT2_9AQUI|nr:polysaccharide ABC transporter ATP-binding protein [Hydrogenobacter hydrogenophilus]SNZ13416.1 lipopolysaccharide transport system ATP-binding protein/teichoic acid transport system ATP-binding protein [Hydrogenobacter hydrogenophilus]
MHIIELKDVSKIYRVYKKPSDRLKEILFRKRFSHEKIALKNINLKVRKGEALGVLGENGAGKSTLLSIMSGVQEPSSGEVRVSGRVSAILELGAGFHPEFTGIENAYMYASLNGLSKKDIDQRIDFIRDFSELGDHIYQPIKTYSTGMVVRLAFSVMIALEPDIFIIDEALSVGDIHFQKKSFDKIREFKERGGTLIFTTHSTYQITNICDRAIWLKDGSIQMEGDPFYVVKEYEDYMREKDKGNTNIQIQRANITHAYIEDFKLSHQEIRPGYTLKALVRIKSSKREKVVLAIIFRRNDNIMLSVYSTKHEGVEIVVNDSLDVVFSFEDFPLLYGRYFADAYLLDESASVIYDVKSLPFDVPKGSVLELGIFRIKGKLELNPVRYSFSKL